MMLTTIVFVFIIGYLAIVFEEKIHINKTASALVTGVLCWTIYAVQSPDFHAVESELVHHFAEAAEILFFLLGAMTIVELIDAHEGFDLINRFIKTRQKRTLLWIVSFVAFIFSAVLDNLTTTIVMISIIRKLMSDADDRMFFVSMVVIAANAGGAFSPIGDVTTTMLWIGGQVTTLKLIEYVFIPSVVCLVAPLLFVSIKMKGEISKPESTPSVDGAISAVTEQHRKIVFIVGVAALLFVPIFKTITHLPPFMGMLLSLGLMWIVCELLNKNKDDEIKHPLSPAGALERIDAPSILFFAGILLAVGTLESTQILRGVAESLSQTFGNEVVIASLIGMLSAVVDNVPIVAAAMGMYDLNQFPQDHTFWHLIAYCAGTGGSMLIIGSAAGVAAMGMEKIEFFWYFKRITFLAAIGYFAGILIYALEHYVLG